MYPEQQQRLQQQQHQYHAAMSQGLTGINYGNLQQHNGHTQQYNNRMHQQPPMGVGRYAPMGWMGHPAGHDFSLTQVQQQQQQQQAIAAARAMMMHHQQQRAYQQQQQHYGQQYSRTQSSQQPMPPGAIDALLANMNLRSNSEPAPNFLVRIMYGYLYSKGDGSEGNGVIPGLPSSINQWVLP
jgi:hypothetical protein